MVGREVRTLIVEPLEQPVPAPTEIATADVGVGA
jgi:hypothetical protein